MTNIILGAGVTGLTAGAKLKDCIILEKESSIGGLAKTIRCDGFKFDFGGHRFFSNDAEIYTYFNKLLKEELITVFRKSKIRRNGRYLDYPLSPALLFQENIFHLSRLFFTYIFRKIFKKKSADSFENYLINHFGDAIYKCYFKNYTEKVWGLACRDLSSDLARERIRDVSVIKALQNIFLRHSNVKSFVDKFKYPEDGIGRLCEKLSQGLDIKTGANVTAIKKQGGRITAVTLETGETLECDNLVSTVPINDLVFMLDPPARVIEAVSRLKYRDIIIVFLAYQEQRIFDWHWIYTPGREIFGRIHEPKNWSGFMAPDGQTGICLEICCEREDSLWRLGDDVLIERCVHDLCLDGPPKVIFSRVERIKNAYPVYFCDYKENLSVVYDFLSGYSNLFTAGRTGRYSYLNMDDCIREGFNAADKIKNAGKPEGR